MKITDITSYIGKGVHLVQVDTDEGITGLGECSAMAPDITSSIVKARFKPHLLGMDPFSVHAIEETCLVQHGGYKTAGQLQAMAYSGIDIALWDIMGKKSRQPVYNLLGGKYRETIEMYASSMSRDLTVEQECAKLEAALLATGCNAVKIKVGPRMGSSREKIGRAHV